VRPPGVGYTERGKRTLRPMMCIVDMESTIVAPHPLRGSVKLLLTGVILSCPLANLLCRKIAREESNTVGQKLSGNGLISKEVYGKKYGS
jgi:hypothetical protein